MKEILLIRLSAIGDILLTSPVLALIKRRYPGAKISFLVKEQYADFVEAFPEVDQTITWAKNKSVWSIRQSLVDGGQKYDLIVDLQSNLKTRILSLVTPGRLKRRYRKPYLNRLLLVFFKINRYREKKKISERYIEALKDIPEFNLAVPEYELRVSLKTKALPKPVAQFIQKPTILIAPGARWATKRWPDEYFVSLASKLLEKQASVQIAWLGGEGEAEVFRFLANHPYLKRHTKRMLFLSGALSVAEMAELANSVRVVVTNDSGLMHLMSSAATPLIALFLSTVEEFGFFPLGKQSQVLTARNIPCRPCDHKGLGACPKKHFRCGRELTADEVYAAVAPHLQISPSASALSLE